MEKNKEEQTIELNDFSRNRKKNSTVCIKDPLKDSKYPKKELKFILEEEQENNEKYEIETSKEEEKEINLINDSNILETNMSSICITNYREETDKKDTDLKIMEDENDNKMKRPNEEVMDETKSKKSGAIKILIDGLKVRIANHTITHQDFVLSLYKNSPNEDIKKEILKFFVIESDDKAVQEKNKNNSHSNSIIKELSDNQIKEILNKNSENIVSNINKEKLNVQSEEPSSLSVDVSKNMTVNLINNEVNNSEKNNQENFLKFQVKLRYKQLLRFLRLIYFFFKTEYRLIIIFVKQFNIVTKTTMWTLICSRLITSLTICAILSPRTDNEDKSSTVLKDIFYRKIFKFIINIKKFLGLRFYK